VAWVPVRAPNSGMVEEAAQSRDGSIDTKWMARVSPGLGPFHVERPGLGVDEGELDHPGDQVRPAPGPAAEGVLGPQLQDAPGRTRRTGGTPPKVQANSPGPAGS
jgi:hypothetical protein